jgi:glycosyltransferase involved in cell wall biosynthesis
MAERRKKPGIMEAADRRIRVVHIITRLDKGGSSEVVLELAARMNRDRFNVEIVTGDTGDPICDLSRYTRETGVPITVFKRLVREIHPLYDLLACITLYRHLRRVRPHIAHTHSSKAGILGRIAAAACRAPIVIHQPHGHVFYGYFGSLASRIFVWIERVAARITDRIITLTELGKQDHIRYGIGPADLFVPIPCGIDLARFSGDKADGQALRAELGLRPDERLVLWAGRLTPIKGCDVFLRACALVAPRRPGARFYILGDGPLAGELKALSSALGLDDAVRFMGQQSNIPTWMAAADLFVLSSLNEGLGRVLLEAMASHTPIVATAVGGVGEIVDTGVTGILVPPSDPERLSEGMLTLLHDHETASMYGKNGYEKVREYDTERMVEKTALLYEELIREKGRLCAV